MSRHLTAGQNRNIRVANESFENVPKFKYFGTTLGNQNQIHNEIKVRCNFGNACHHSVLNLFSSVLISKNLMYKIHKTMILPLVECKCDVWSFS